MVTPHDTEDAQLLTDAVTRLAAQQRRVAAAVDAATVQLWFAPPSDAVREELVRLGHFPDYAHELEWSVGFVVGHLTDSARVFTERVERIRDEDRPRFADFVTDEEARLERYRSTPSAEARHALSGAQADLLWALGSVTDADLARPAVHEVDGPLTLADVATFLPVHQRDHAEQLERLLR